MTDSSHNNPDYQRLSDQQFHEMDALSDRFDRELVNGDGPRIETFLAKAPDAGQAGPLAELLAMEIGYRIDQGEEPQLDEYLRRFPEHERIIGDVFDREAAIQLPDKGTISIPVDAPPVLANFRLIKVIGRGGMGVVWLAEQDQPVRRRVALKLIKSELASQEVLARFDAEKQALALMDHQNIAKVLDAGTTNDDRPYFVMELVDGIPITQYCDENKLSVDQRLKLFVSVCKAVQHAHQKGIIHRDLKPTNVLVTVIDGEAVPKVIDFGLAKAVKQNMKLTDATMLTEFGKVVGTVQYMSPEQAELKGMEAQDIDTRTDVYSLGVMLYELLTGSTPLDKEFLGRNALFKILEMIREEDPPRPSNRLSSASNDVNSEVSDLRRTNPARLQRLLQGELDWVVMKALEKDRTRRYQSASDFAQDLSNYLTGAMVAARPPSAWYQIQKFARRNRGLVSAMLAIGIVLLAGVFGTTYGLIRANQKTKLAVEKTEEANEERVNSVRSEKRATAEAQRARDSDATAKFQLAVARYDAKRAAEARSILHQIPDEYRDNFEWHYCKRRFQGSDVTCYGHTGEVYDVAFTPDGKRVTSASGDGKIKIWDSTTGRELTTLEGHEGPVMALAVSPDGSQIASAGDGGAVKIWDVMSGEAIFEMRGHSDAIDCLAFSPNGNRIASASGDKTIKLWDAQSGKEIRTIIGHAGAVLGVAFSPDGKRLASCSHDDKTVRIWDSLSGKQIKIVRQDRANSRRLAFSPDGTRLATISYSRFSLWDTNTWQLVAENRLAHDRIIRCVAFSPDGIRFATANDDATVKIWETTTGNPIVTLSGHASKVWSVAFSPDGSRLVSASEDKTVRIWDVGGSNDLTLGKHSKCIAFSSDGKRFASGDSDGTIILWDAKTNQALFTMRGHEGLISDLSFSPDGHLLVSGSDDHTARLWNAHNGEKVAVLKGHTSWVRGVAFSPDSTQLATAGWDGALKLWDAHSHQETNSLEAHRGGLYSVAFSPDGSSLASSSFDRTIKLWDAHSGQELRTLTGHTGRVRTLAFGPDGKRLVSGGYDPKVRVWDVSSGDQIATVNQIVAAIFRIAISPDGTRIATACTSDKIHLYDTRAGEEIMPVFTGGSRVIAFSPDSKRLVSAGNKGVRILDARQDHETTILSGHTDKVTSATFSSDGSRIYSESENEKLVWDAFTRETIPNETWNPPEVSNHDSPDHRWFVSAESNNVVLVDREFKYTPDEKAYRRAKSRFDPHWHQEQATAASKAENWYAAVFHYAWLLKHDPNSLANYVGLQSSYRRLTARDSAEVEALSLVRNVTGNGHGTFYAQQKQQIVTALPATPFKSTEEFAESPTKASDSNHSLYFDGASYADLGNSPFYKASFTVEGWVKPTTTRGNLAAVFSVRDGGDTAIAAEVSRDGTLRALLRNPPANVGGLDISSETNVVDGGWHHFAVVKGEDDKLHLYIDGSLEASSDEAAADFNVTPYQVFLGVSIEKNPRYYRGLMDEIRFWNSARTIEQINQDSNKQIDPQSDGLAAYYDFNRSIERTDSEKELDTHFYLVPVVKEALKLHVAASSTDE